MALKNLFSVFCTCVAPENVSGRLGCEDEAQEEHARKGTVLNTFVMDLIKCC